MASISVDDARYIISKLYPGPIWKDKVKNMPDKQVLAVYYSSCERGAFDKPSKKRDRKCTDEEPRRENKKFNKPEKRERVKAWDYPVNDDDDLYAEQLSFDI